MDKNKVEFNLIGILKNALHYKKFISYFVIIGMIVFAVYSMIIPQTYATNATIMPPDESKSMGELSSFVSEISQGVLLDAVGGKSSQSVLYKEILISRSLVKEIIDSLRLDENDYFEAKTELTRIDMLQEMLDVEVYKTGIIEVSCSMQTGYLPDEKDIDTVKYFVSKIANVAVETLDRILRRKKNSTARKSKIYIQKTLGQYRQELDSLESELEQFRTENKVLQLEDQTQAAVAQASEVGSELTKAEIELTLAKQMYNENSPIIRAMQENVIFLRKQYLKTQTGGLTDEDMFSIPFGRMPALIRDFTKLKMNEKILQQVIIYLETQKHQQIIQEHKNIPLVEFLDKAYVPEKRTSPKRAVFMAISTTILLFIALSAVTLHSLWKGRLYIRKIAKSEEI